MDNHDQRLDEHARRAVEAHPRNLARQLYFNHRALIEKPPHERPPRADEPRNHPLRDRFQAAMLEVERLPVSSLRPFVESLMFTMHLDLYGWWSRPTDTPHEAHRTSDTRQREAQGPPPRDEPS